MTGADGMTTVEELCAEVVGRAEHTICRGCGATDIEYDRSGIGHAIAGSVPDQCGPVETVEEDQLCGHPESAHEAGESLDGNPFAICASCTLVPAMWHAYRAPEAS